MEETNPEILKVTRGRKDGIQAGFSDEMNHSQMLSELTTRSIGNAYVAKRFSMVKDEELDVTDLAQAIDRMAKEVANGNLHRLEAILVGQTISLDVMFQSLTLRANQSEYLKAMESLMRLALKAQSQCRSTIEALGVLKNPGTYIQQANIAHGHQQVNNIGKLNGSERSKSVRNKLMDGTVYERLDTRAKSQAISSNQGLETMGKIHRP